MGLFASFHWAERGKWDIDDMLCDNTIGNKGYELQMGEYFLPCHAPDPGKSCYLVLLICLLSGIDVVWRWTGPYLNLYHTHHHPWCSFCTIACATSTASVGIKFLYHRHRASRELCISLQSSGSCSGPFIRFSLGDRHWGLGFF